MEFKTSQGGETTLVFEPHEEQALVQLSSRTGTSLADIKAQITKQRQANPLAGFTELIGLTFQGAAAAMGGGLAPSILQKPKSKPSTRMDPLLVLENSIRLKLNQASGSVGATSQMQIVEATLLQALATCLQTQMLREMLERLDKPVVKLMADSLQGDLARQP